MIRTSILSLLDLSETNKYHNINVPSSILRTFWHSVTSRAICFGRRETCRICTTEVMFHNIAQYGVLCRSLCSPLKPTIQGV